MSDFKNIYVSSIKITEICDYIMSLNENLNDYGIFFSKIFGICGLIF